MLIIWSIESTACRARTELTESERQAAGTKDRKWLADKLFKPKWCAADAAKDEDEDERDSEAGTRNLSRPF